MHTLLLPLEYDFSLFLHDHLVTCVDSGFWLRPSAADGPLVPLFTISAPEPVEQAGTGYTQNLLLPAQPVCWLVCAERIKELKRLLTHLYLLQTQHMFIVTSEVI